MAQEVAVASAGRLLTSRPLRAGGAPYRFYPCRKGWGKEGKWWVYLFYIL